MVLGRSGLDSSGLGGQGEPGESHQESVTNRQTNNQAIIEHSRSFESMVLNWLDLEFGKCVCMSQNIKCVCRSQNSHIQSPFEGGR